MATGYDPDTLLFIMEEIGNSDPEYIGEDTYEIDTGEGCCIVSITSTVLQASERLRELEAGREHLISQKNRINEAYCIASKLNSEKNQKLSMKMVELRKLKRDNDQLREQNAALAAHVERLKEFITNAPVSAGVCCCGDAMDRHPDPISCGHSPVDEWDYAAQTMFNDTPTTSLAQRDARMKAEALRVACNAVEDISGNFTGDTRSGMEMAVRIIEDYRDEYRQQAEEKS